MNTWTDPHTGETYYITSPKMEFMPPPTCFVINGNAGKEVLRIERNRITVGEGVEVTEAAHAVLDALRGLLGDWERRVWNEAIDAAIKVGEPYESRSEVINAAKVKRLKK